MKNNKGSSDVSFVIVLIVGYTLFAFTAKYLSKSKVSEKNKIELKQGR